MFKEYAPLAFHYIRDAFHVDPESYMVMKRSSNQS